MKIKFSQRELKKMTFGDWIDRLAAIEKDGHRLEDVKFGLPEGYRLPFLKLPDSK